MITMVIDAPILKDKEFVLFQKMIYDAAGINMSDAKKALVSGRLAKRVKHYSLASYEEYFQLLSSGANDELQMAVDLLTTNETFFFREQKHFDFLRDRILPTWGKEPRRLWSAASSTGEEAYTLAMLLAEHSPTDNWEIVGTDISTRVVEKARTGHYPVERAEKIPRSYLTRYCLKGTGNQEGTFLIDKALRKRVSFVHANLNDNLTNLGNFDIIFLRNVLIYFDLETKQHVISRLVRQLKRGGHIIVGHSESLNGISNELTVVVPSVYRKP
jgi:chemotaxis protein methyltransferase CheR